MLPQPWKTLSTREVYRNKWMRLREDIAEIGSRSLAAAKPLYLLPKSPP